MSHRFNLLTPVSDLRDERFETLLNTGALRIERIVSHGHASPPGFWYDQDHGEWVALMQGRAHLRLEGQADLVELGRGDCLHIPARQRHRVEWTDSQQPTIWLAVHYRADRCESSP